MWMPDQRGMRSIPTALAIAFFRNLGNIVNQTLRYADSHTLQTFHKNPSHIAHLCRSSPGSIAMIAFLQASLFCVSFGSSRWSFMSLRTPSIHLSSGLPRGRGLVPPTFIVVMLVSHCGEYPCECKKIYSRQIRQIVANIWRMGLRMQFATNRNDRKMIAIYS